MPSLSTPFEQNKCENAPLRHSHIIIPPPTIIVIAGCIIIFVVSLLKEKGINIRETIASYNIVIRWIIYIGFIMFILIYGSTSTTSDFIYANF